MRKLLILFLILFLATCKFSNSSKEDSESIFMNLGLLGIRSNKLTVSGTAVKGIVKNAIVTLNPLNTDGSCNSETILATGNTNEDTGGYSLVYNKTGSIVCLTVSPNSSGQTKMFDEKLNSDITISGSSNFKLVTILPESKISNNNRKNTLISPFSKMLGRRFQNLIRQSGEGADKTALHRKASKEIVIRFGLSSGLSAAASPSMYSTRAGGISDTLYPELDDIMVELENPASPLSAKFTSILVGLSQLANTYKNGASLSIDDIDAIIEAFASDFEDGVFDGKTSTGASITIGPVGNQITFSSTPLTTTLLPAITTYIQNGGNLSLGLPTSTPPPTITTTEITNQTQFVDNAVITFPSLGSPPTISYSGTPFTFTVGSAISAISPVTVNGITNCVVTPALPTGLILSTACQITGTPTSIQTSTTYTVTAYNTAGSGTTTVDIIINANPPSALAYTGSPFIFLQNSAISALNPTFTGSVTTCSASPTLPTGLTINTTTCVISGTPTGSQTSTAYTITASNFYGNTAANINIQINAQISISYTGSPFIFAIGVPISNLTPSVGNGPATSFSISPAIPSGLSFNTSTGVISGTPSTYFTSTAFTITANSAANGSNNTVIAMAATYVYNFTNAGQTGRLGPSQTAINAAYSGTSLAGTVTATATGIQQWTVPTTGTYKIETYGAQGATNDAALARGASMIGNFSLTAGQTIWILVGQQGLGTPGVYMNVGGGGGTFVATGASLGTSTALIVAGGGAGTQTCCNQAGSAGSTATSGNAGMNSNTTGGTGGTSGGAGGVEPGNEATPASGFSGSGASSQSFLAGGAGAVGTPAGTDGGFGGGGAAIAGGYSKAGGGGGYSGGGSSGAANGQTFAGGGGGSFNSGTSQVNTAGANPGHGKVIITYISP